MTHSSALQLDAWTHELAHTFRAGYQPIGVILYESTGQAPIQVDFYQAIFAALVELPATAYPRASHARGPTILRVRNRAVSERC